MATRNADLLLAQREGLEPDAVGRLHNGAERLRWPEPPLMIDDRVAGDAEGPGAERLAVVAVTR
jgi:hypothetical protein